jgi:hypothetical protein
MMDRHQHDLKIMKDEIELHREKLRSCQLENERIIASINQEEGFKEDVQRQIDLVQSHFLAEIAERDENEKHLRDLLVDKRDLADEL